MPDTVNPPETLPPIPPLPANSAVLAVRAGEDRVHTFMRLNYDVTHLSEDSQKLLLFMLTQALTELEKGVKSMSRIEAASKLATLERAKAVKGNGN